MKKQAAKIPTKGGSMQKTAVLMALMLVAALAIADVPTTCPPETPQNNAWFGLPESPVPDVVTGEQGSSVQLVTDDPDMSLVPGSPAPRGEGDGTSIRIPPFYDWGNDILVGEPSTTPAWGRLSVDTDNNGNIYVGLLDPSGTNEDTIHVWRSSNGGGTWTKFLRILPGTTNGGIDDYVLRVGSDANGVWVYHFCLYNAAGTNGGIWALRHRYPYANAKWTHVVDNTAPISRITADRNVESPQHLFCGWAQTAGSIKMMSSKDSAETWGNLRNVSSGSMAPSVCAGGDGYVYLTFGTTDSAWIWAGRYTNNLISPSMVFNKFDSSSDRHVYNVSVAAHRAAPGASQTAVAMYSHMNTNGNIPPHYAYTTNGGTSWTYTFWPVTNQGRTTWDYRFPYIRRSYNSELFRAVVTGPEGSWDTLVYAFTRATDPTTWEDRGTHNDHRITGEFGCQIDYSSMNMGGYIVYREYAGTNIWFDGYTTGMEEKGMPGQPGVRAGVATLLGRNPAFNLELDRPTAVTAAIHDGTGRMLKDVYSGTLSKGHHRVPISTAGLSQGVYFLNIDLDGSTQTAKLIISQ
jgi:hypothetical protein